MESARLAALAAICDTFIPALQIPDDPHGYWVRKASDQGVPARIMALLQQAKAEDRDEFDQLLGLLASPLLGLSWLGPLKPAHKLSETQRQTLLRRWAASPLSDIRKAYNSLRKLTTFLYFGDVAAGGTENPNWITLGYQPVTEFIQPDPNPLPVWRLPETKALSAEARSASTHKSSTLHSPPSTVSCDVLVIGSGAGGSIIASELAAAGQDVLVVEKGKYTQAHEFTQAEFPMLNRHFEAGALLSSKNGSISVLAGSTLGGGTTVNWAASLRTTDYILEEWAIEHGNPHFLEKDYQKGFEIVERRNNINIDFQHNPQNQALFDAAGSLNYRVEKIPLNMRFPAAIPGETAWKAAGFSCLGDAYGIKQGAVQTFLQDATKHGARLLTETTVENLNVRNGEVIGAQGFTILPDGQKNHLGIHAKRVVLCAGALHTPVILLKSGLQHPQIGRNLFLHPVVAVPGFYNGEILPWYGPMMSVIVQEFTRLDGNWGFRIENPPIHPGLAAFALSWGGGEAFKRALAHIRNIGVQIGLVRDRFGGRITVGKKSGQPVIHYNLHSYDRNHLVRAMQESVRLHHAAGAERIMVLHNQPKDYFPQKDHLEEFIHKIPAMNWGLNRFGLFSAHQMGTCRMGGSREYPVKPNGETREVRNLFVADASLFPSASGTNPMLSVQALAWWVSQNIKQNVV